MYKYNIFIRINIYNFYYINFYILHIYIRHVYDVTKRLITMATNYLINKIKRTKKLKKITDFCLFSNNYFLSLLIQELKLFFFFIIFDVFIKYLVKGIRIQRNTSFAVFSSRNSNNKKYYN